MAEDTVKYQFFKTDVAISKFRIQDKSYTTLKNYFSIGLNYIKTNERKYPYVAKAYYDALENAVKRCVQPLIPKKNEERRTIERTKIAQKKEVKLPINDVITATSTTAKVDFGIKVGNVIYLEENEAMQKVFLRGVQAMGGQGQLVTVEILNMEENEQCQK